MISLLARNETRPRPLLRRRPAGGPGGLAPHTTGSGIAERARKAGHTLSSAELLALTVSYYQGAMDRYERLKGIDTPEATAERSKLGWPSAVIGLEGEIVQLLTDDVVAHHIGVSAAHRAAYLNGTWTKTIPAAVVDRWRAAWPAYPSPAHLYPGASANSYYFGVELCPTTHTIYQPAGTGQRFTARQYDSLARLGVDLARRHGWPHSWWTSARFAGHGEVAILDRMDAGGEWDPGWIRVGAPYFDKAAVQALIAEGSG